MKTLFLVTAISASSIAACSTEPVSIGDRSGTGTATSAAPATAPAVTPAVSSSVTATPAAAQPEPNGAELVETDASLPSCTASTGGQLYYVAADKEFKACVDAQWEVIDLTGKQGSAGAQGPQGAPGVAGPTGGDGCYFTTGEYLGVGVGTNGAAGQCSVIMFADGARLRVDENGGFYDGGGYDNNNCTSAACSGMVCGYAATGCAGTCLPTGSYNADIQTVTSIPKGALFKTMTGWLVSTGQDANLGSTAFQSYSDNTGCHEQAWTAGSAFDVVTAWTPPVALSFPLGPIYEGVPK